MGVVDNITPTRCGTVGRPRAGEHARSEPLCRPWAAKSATASAGRSAVADLFLPYPDVGLDALTSSHQKLVLISATTGGDRAVDFWKHLRQ